MALTNDETIVRLENLLADMKAPPPAPPVQGIHVGPGDNLRSMVAGGAAGAVYVIDPAYVQDGGWTIPKPCKLVSAGSIAPGRAVVTRPSPTLRGATVFGAPGIQLSALRLEGGVKEETIVTTANDALLDSCILAGTTQGQHRGVSVNDSVGVTVIRCSITGIWAGGQDTQAISGDYGTKTLLVDDCLLEASGENLIFGGSDAQNEAAIPDGIIIQNCSLNKCFSWRGVASCKNLLELKCAKHVTFRKNDCQYSFLVGDLGQAAFAVVLTVRNQDGGAIFSTISDVLIEDNTFTHCGGGISILAVDDTHPSIRMSNMTIRRNAFVDVDPAAWGGLGREIQILSGPNGLVLDGNTFEGKNLNSAFTLAGPPTNGLSVMNNRFQEGDYGIKGDGDFALGKDAIDHYAPGYVWTNNTMVKGTSGRSIVYPTGTILV